MSIRLVDTHTLQLKSFGTDAPPVYVILSHTWNEDEEISYEEMRDLWNDPNHLSRKKKGYYKIKMTCKRASEHNIKYAWVDTCCIDKKSSSELGEAINSMFEWYKRAEECYVFLGDLKGSFNLAKSLPQCRWFTRGWCLQELIAPRQIRFFNGEWGFIGTKAELRSLISSITNIEIDVLMHKTALYSVPVARKMSWASKRVTTRREDIAYCLLGIFDVNMPMLYGEGGKAFLRLQEEILKRSNDLSLFYSSISIDSPRKQPDKAEKALGRVDNSESEEEWETMSKEYQPINPLPFRSLFARSPRGFMHGGSVVKVGSTIMQSKMFSLTNSGLHFPKADFQVLQLEMERSATPVLQGCYLLPLGCRKQREGDECVMVLQKVGPARFARVRHSWLRYRWKNKISGSSEDEPYEETEEALIITNIHSDMYGSFDAAPKHSIGIRMAGNDMRDALQDVRPRERWDAAHQRFLTRGSEAFEGSIVVYPSMISASYDMQVSAKEGSTFFHLACGIDRNDKSPRAWVRLYSSDEWAMFRSRIGKMTGLKYLKKLSTHHVLGASDALAMGKLQIEAKVIEMAKYEFLHFVILLEMTYIHSRVDKKQFSNPER